MTPAMTPIMTSTRRAPRPIAQDVTHTLQRSFAHWVNCRFNADADANADATRAGNDADPSMDEREEYEEEEEDCMDESIRNDTDENADVDVDVDVDVETETHNEDREGEKGSTAKSLLDAEADIESKSELAEDIDIDIDVDAASESVEKVKADSGTTAIESKAESKAESKIEVEVEVRKQTLKEKWWKSKSRLKTSSPSSSTQVEAQENPTVTNESENENDNENDDENENDNKSEPEVNGAENIVPVREERKRQRSRSSWWNALVENTGNDAYEHDHEDHYQYQRPDSRFFWNEEFVTPLLQANSESDDTTRHGEYSNSKSSSSPLGLPHHALLDHVIPVTSAFVGVQKNVTLVPSTTTTTNLNGAQAQAPLPLYAITYDQLLISRRSKYRAGTRFTRRGADAAGDVANFAETEQICLVRDDYHHRDNIACNDESSNVIANVNANDYGVQEVYAHVQTRGSIPIRWSSPSDIKTYRPKVMIGTDPLGQARALRGHLVEQLALYCNGNPEGDGEGEGADNGVKLAFINLIDKHSDQGRLGRTFSSVLDAVLATYQDHSNGDDSSNENIDTADASVTRLLNPESVSHIWYDFHAECKGGRWDKLKYLLDDVREYLDDQDYFCAAVPSSGSSTGSVSPTWEIMRVQDGTVRSNCMDCLDRTNVVQSMFGRYVLYNQLNERIGLQNQGARRKLPLGFNVAFKRNMLTLPWKDGEVKHRSLWADNADAISRLYAGTPALKGDFTRTGKRTKRGALDDGVNSLTRFYLNNFIDADRQEGMDLLTGFAKFDTTENVEYEVARVKVTTKQNNKHPKKKKKGWGLFDQRLKGLAEQEKIRTIALDPRLSLSWLPGDLQSHLRSVALTSLTTYDDEPLVKHSMGISLSAALKDIDRRAMLDEPWWAGDDSSSEDDNQSSALVRKTSTTMTTFKASSSSYAAGALIASLKAPISSAVALICFMLPALISPSD